MLLCTDYPQKTYIRKQLVFSSVSRSEKGMVTAKGHKKDATKKKEHGTTYQTSILCPSMLRRNLQTLVDEKIGYLIFFAHPNLL
jgi:hypothetical protein